MHQSIIPSGGVPERSLFLRGLHVSIRFHQRCHWCHAARFEQWSSWGEMKHRTDSIERNWSELWARRENRNDPAPGTLWLDYPSVGGPIAGDSRCVLAN